MALRINGTARSACLSLLALVLLFVTSVEALSPPEPVSNGTGLFIGTFGVLIIWAYVLTITGHLSKDMFYISTVILATLGVATWLLWLCAWMHQWHPLIVPQYKMEHAESESSR